MFRRATPTFSLCGYPLSTFNAFTMQLYCIMIPILMAIIKLLVKFQQRAFLSVHRCAPDSFATDITTRIKFQCSLLIPLISWALSLLLNTNPRIALMLLRRPTFLAQLAIRRFSLLFCRPAASIASCIFSHTRGTPKNRVGRTSAIVCFSVPCHHRYYYRRLHQCKSC